MEDPASSDDELYWLEALESPKIPRIYLERTNPFDELEDHKFRERFRLTKPTVLNILTQIEHQLEYTSNRNASLSPINQLLLTLRFLATGTFQLVIADSFGVDKSTASRLVHKVILAIAALSRKYIKFPSAPDQLHATMNKFYNTAMFPGVIGAVDCTHVPIFSPGGDDAEAFRNRKTYFSFNVQLISDPDLYITDVVARWPGSVHDSTIFDFSCIRARFENGQIPEGYLIGDSGYSCRSYLLTPINNPISAAEEEYNSRHVQARNCIERANGVLKRRFGCLKYGLRIKTARIPVLIVAAVVLHNIAVTLGEEEPPEDRELDEYIENLRMDGTNLDFEDVEVIPPPPTNQVGAFAQRTALITEHFALIV